MNLAHHTHAPARPLRRIRLWYALLLVIAGVFLVRLFYLQVIRYDYYHNSALQDQLREYQIAPARGVIRAHEGGQIVPLVLNEKLHTVYADPTLVKDAPQVAVTLSGILKGDAAEYEKKLKSLNTRYVVLAKKVTEVQKKRILKYKYPGVGAQEQHYRTYPNASLAAQLLGFVNDEGKGTYGLEQALNKQLSGTPGELKAVTDVNGVPLAANTDNVLKEPVPGSDVVLTVDLAMQKQLEDILQQGLKDAKSNSGSALIMDPQTGAVKAMANWPTYDPASYATTEDGSVFNNPAVSTPIEIGSIMKPLTAAAALDKGVVQPHTTYYDPAQWKVDGYKITNIEEDGGAGTKSIADILNLSLNTGATWLLMKMGGSGDTITDQARKVWHEYMTTHYRLGKATGIEQGYEAEGSIPHPTKGYGRDLTYANTSFGQGMTATITQMAAAFSAMLNGGTYYQPRLIDQVIAPDGTKEVKKPVVLQRNVVSPAVSEAMQPLLEYVVEKHYFKPRFDQKTYSVGGKTGTAEIAKPEGGYHKDEFNGTYVGFVGGDRVQYVIAVRVDKPKIAGYAGSAAAQPLFGKLAHMLIANFNVTPKGQ